MPTTAASDDLLSEKARNFAALGDPARLRILNLIRHGEEVCNCEIGNVTGFLASKISRHLATLKQAGLVRERREGTYLHYRLDPSGDPFGGNLVGLLDSLAADDPLLREDRDRLEKRLSC